MCTGAGDFSVKSVLSYRFTRVRRQINGGTLRREGQEETTTMAEIGAGDATPSKKVKLEHGVLEMPNLPDVKKILLDRALQALDDDVLFGFNLLKITNSNAEMCVPFKNSFVKIERSSDPDPKQLITQRKIVYNFAGVFEKGVEILRLYLKDPKNPEDKEVRLALLRLTSTILKIEG